MNALAHKLAAPTPILAPAGDWAEAYDRLAAMEVQFTPLQIGAMELNRSQTVLDIGAGSGRLSIPLARCVKSVTALDSSRALLDRCGSNAREALIGNVATHEADWDAVVPGRDLPKHDVVIASRFTGEQDLMKLDAAANELVYVLMFAGPSTKALYNVLLEGIVAPEPEAEVAQSGTVAMFNELAELGIEPNVVHVPTGFTRWYRDEREAFADFDWLDVEPSLRSLLNRNIRRFLVPAPHGGVRFLFETKCSIVWWRK
jgi:SAM-dependent methyltransferase